MPRAGMRSRSGVAGGCWRKRPGASRAHSNEVMDLKCLFSLEGRIDPAHPRSGDRPSIQMSRPGRTEDIARAVVYLSALAGSYLTGVVIPVSGGIATIA